MNYTVNTKFFGTLFMLVSFCALRGQMAYTAGAFNVTASSATLYGGVGNLSAPATIWFQYAKTGDTAVHTVAGIPANISDSQYYSDSAQVSGLSPYVLYLFRILVLMGTDTIYGNYSGFYTGLNPVVTANPASNITTSSAILTGSVSDAPPGSQVYFQFWTGSNFPNPLAATPAVISDTFSHPVSAQVNGLLPYTWYNYWVNVMDSDATWQSNTVQFYTGTGSPYYVNTLAATNVTSTSATLNGEVGNLPFTSSLYFDYWTSGNNHTTIAANPSTVSDTNQHNVSADIAGLGANTSYWFRLEAVDSLTVRYGDSTAIYTGANDIPNFDFENWDSVSGQKPVGWYNIFGPVEQISPGYSGNYAVKLQHASAGGLGALINGYPDIESNGNGNNVPPFYGGVPYTARPDTFTGWFQYNIVPGDTAYTLVILKAQGQVIAQSFYPITGSSSAWQQLYFPISYTSSATPDTLVVGVIPTNVNGNGNILGSWVIADALGFQGPYPPIPNGGFEDWQQFSFAELNNWNYMDMLDWGVYSNPDSECVMQSTDAEHGHFAAQIRNIPFLGSWILGTVSTEPLMNGGNQPSFAVNHAVQSFDGWYQFYPVNGDTFVAGCVLFYQGNQVGGGTFSTTEPAASYTQFSVNMSYNNNVNVTPDSASIVIQTFSSIPQGNSWALVDNLSFDGFASAIQEEGKGSDIDEDIQVYPNPNSGKFTINYPVKEGEQSYFEIIDMLGRTVYAANGNGAAAGKKEFELPGLAAGIYIINVRSGGTHMDKKLVIQH